MADTVGAAQHLKCVFMPDIGLLTEFERSMIQKRVRAGLKRAKAEGKPSWSASDWCPARTANP